MERISNNFLPLLAKAREGNQEAQQALVGLMAKTREPELYLSQMLPGDEEWLAKVAQPDPICPTKENFAAMGLLIFAKTTRYRVWQEDFTDEDTGKPVSLMRCELVDGTFFKEDARQTQKLVDAVAQLVAELIRRYDGHSDVALYIPLGVAMQVMVGSHEYHGNILSMERPEPDRLLLRAEANSPLPLLYALRQSFPHVETVVL